MKKEKNDAVPYEVFKDILNKAHKNRDNVDYLETAMEYVFKQDSNLYNAALKYADKLKENYYFTEEEKKNIGNI